MRDVIIAGGSGFIGRNLAARIKTLVEPGCRVIAVSSQDVDLIHRENAFAWFEKHHWTSDVSHIFHLAAVYKAGGWPAKHPATQFHANMAINLNLLEAWKRFFPSAKLTSVVSYCMYPDHDRPHPESELYGTEPEEYLYAYAFTKKALIVGQRAYCQEFGLTAVSAVLSTVYGSGDSLMENSHVMGALIGKFIRAVKEGLDEVEVWGDGSQEREFLHVDDAVSGIISIAARARSPVLNLGTGESVKISTIAEAIKLATGFKGVIAYNTDRFVGARRRVLDNRLALNELDWVPSVTLQDGIRRTVLSALGNAT